MLPLIKSVEEGGLTADFFGHPFYEEYPTTPANYTLNGFMFTLFGLYDWSVVDPESEAGRLYREGRDALICALPFYDQGNTSAYHLGQLFNPPRKVHSSAHYHTVHIRLLRELHTIEPNPILEFYAKRWQSYIDDAKK